MDYTGYDELGQVVASTETVDSNSYSFTYGYDVAGLVREAYPSGRVVSMSHDGAGRVSTVWNGEVNSANKYADSIAYAPHGGLSGFKLGNNKYEETCYNTRLQPFGIRVGAATTPGTCTNTGNSDLLNVSFGYGTAGTNNGNLLSQTIAAAGNTFSQSYGYDAFNRLTSAGEGTGKGARHKSDGSLGGPAEI